MKKTAYRKTVYDQLLPLFGERGGHAVERIIYEDFILDESKFPKEELSEAEQAKVTALIEELKTGKPVQYLVGKAMFTDMVLEVNPAVLIPRPETEELVYKFLQILKREGMPTDPILDIGTGSGCIALALKKAHPELTIIAIDKSEEALEVAKRNAEKFDLEIDFRQMDILDKATWSALPELGAIISNPPYIPEKEKVLMEKNVKFFEPSMALFVSDDEPIIFYQAIAELAKEKLKKDGWLAAEMNEHLSSETMGVFIVNGLLNLQIERDLSQKYRFVTGRKG